MRRRFAAAALVLILVLAFLAVRQVQSQQPQGVLGSQKLAYPSLESQLSDLVERAVAAPETAPTLAEEAPLSEGDAVAVTMHVTGDPDDVVRHLAAHEISPANVNADFIEAYVPLLDLPDLVARDDIVRIEFIHPPRPD